MPSTQAEGILGLVDNAVAGAAVHVLILAAASLIHHGLTGGLVVIGLRTAVPKDERKSVVNDHSEDVEADWHKVQTYRATLSVVSVKVCVQESAHAYFGNMTSVFCVPLSACLPLTWSCPESCAPWSLVNIVNMLTRSYEHTSGWVMHTVAEALAEGVRHDEVLVNRLIVV